MNVISVLNQKGGAGKTTLSLNIATALYLMGFDVLMVDSDKQGSLRDWRAVDEENPLPVVGLDRPTLDRDLKSLVKDKGLDFVIIDGMPSVSEMAISTIKISDFVLIPIQPSPLDLWATSDLVDIIKQRIEITDGALQSAFVINRSVKNTSLSNEINEAVEQFDLPILKTHVHQRMIYAKSIIAGQTVFNFQEQNKQAIDEINGLTKEILNKLGVFEDV